MKEFIQVLKRFVPPYKKYLVLTVLFNILSALLNIFSFMAIIPILNILSRGPRRHVGCRRHPHRSWRYDIPRCRGGSWHGQVLRLWCRWHQRGL